MKKILIVDDDQEIREMLCKFLNQREYEAVGLETGEKVLEYCRQSDVSLIITDMLMPEKDGMQTITECKKNFPDLKIIAISGGGMQSGQKYLALAESAGADYTITKPFHPNDILMLIQQCVQ